LIKGQIEGEKFASVRMVDARSLEKYRARMERLGRKKHGLRSVTSTEFTLSTVEGLSAGLSLAEGDEGVVLVDLALLSCPGF